MSRIYLAGPLFCDSEREYNEKVRDRLVEEGHQVVLPQDCDLLFEPLKMKDPEYAKVSAHRVFLNDISLIDSCDTLVFNLDGRVPDEGACVELGYSFAKGMRLLGLKTDVRVSEFGLDNMMISGMLGDNVARSLDELVLLLRKA